MSGISNNLIAMGAIGLVGGLTTGYVEGRGITARHAPQGLYSLTRKAAGVTGFATAGGSAYLGYQLFRSSQSMGGEPSIMAKAALFGAAVPGVLIGLAMGMGHEAEARHS